MLYGYLFFFCSATVTAMPKGSRCAVCGEETRQKCSGCCEVYYCGRECQHKHWREEHKAVCNPNTMSFKLRCLSAKSVLRVCHYKGDQTVDRLVKRAERWVAKRLHFPQDSIKLLLIFNDCVLNPEHTFIDSKLTNGANITVILTSASSEDMCEGTR